MTLWIVIAVTLLLTAFWLARPFLKRGGLELAEAEHSISIFRDQKDELERDLREGLISPDERDAAEQEIEMRALRAARNIDGGLTRAKVSPLKALLAMAILSFGSLALYWQMGTPEAPDQPLEARRQALLERRAQAGDLESRAELLVAKVEEEPDSFENWWLLARSYAAMGDHASAADAYREAARLSDDRPSVLSAYAEALTLANGNKVPQAARLIFSQVISNGDDPRARYYLALAKAQDQDFEGALEDWVALLQVSQPEAPWIPIVRRDIVNMAKFLQLDVREVLPDVSQAELVRAGLLEIAEVEGTGQESPDAMMEASITGLETALAQDPKDWQGWIRLAELRAESGDPIAAASALEDGRSNFTGAPFVLAQFKETADRLGLAQDADRAGPDVRRGPSDEQVAAAAQMSESERNAMVRSMVEGLSERLEDEPDNFEGWMMLIRSYAVLQDAGAAQEAYQRAKSVFASDQTRSREITRLAQDLGVAVE